MRGFAVVCVALSAFLVDCVPVAVGDGGDVGDAENCAGPEAIDPTTRSGARLRAYVMATPGGASVFAGFWLDTELGVDCEIRTSRGVSRCYPMSVFSSEFADDECSEPAAKVPPSSSVGFCVRMLPDGERWHRLGRVVTGDSYRVDESGRCVLSSASGPDDGWQTRTCGDTPAVDLDIFVEFSLFAE